MIQVNEHFRLNADKYNVIVEEKKSRKVRGGDEQKDTWIPVSYFPSMPMAVNYIVQRGVKEGITEGSKRLNDRIKRLEQDVSKLRLEINKI